MSANLGNRISPIAPYADTPVPYTRTKGEIELLLNTYGVKGVRWTSLQGQADVLEFIVETEVRGVKKTIVISVKPPQIFVKKRPHGRGPILTVRNPDQEYRLLFYWIKSKIEAVTWGLSTIEREFLSQITTALPDGRTVSVGDIIEERIAEDKLPSLSYFGESPRERIRDDRKPVIDV